MAAVANIVINDGAATPVAHTFAPSRQSGDLFEWNDRAAGVAAGFNKISVLTRYGTSSNAGQRVTLKVIAPTLAVTAPTSGSGVQPNPVAAYTALATIEFLIPNASDAAARANIHAFVKNLVATTFVENMIKNLDAPF
nr:MAG: coat protein [Leviviridae sp.]